jgi:hypothetical protein
MGTYVWDEKAKTLGVDKPLKKNDHVNDSLRYALYTYFGKLLGNDNRMTKEKLLELRLKHGVPYR